MSKPDKGPFEGIDPALEDAITRYGTPPVRECVTVTIQDVGNDSFKYMPQDYEGWAEWLTAARKKCPPEYRDGLNFILQYERGYYDSGDSASFSVWYERPETDDEMTERVNRGIQYVRASQASERAAYEALKRKFEGR